jgi:phosphoribosylformimino-5-aminoimidazole carboxamide ribotide isomerase
MKLRIIPVLDLKNGVVVRGVAGRRETYRPVVSTLTRSSDPLDVARAFRDEFGFGELYVADLGALGGGPPAWPVYERLRAGGFRLWVDAGIRDGKQAAALHQTGVERVIVALEVVPGPSTLQAVLEAVGPDATAFSLDLYGGQPLGALHAWKSNDPFHIAAAVVDNGVPRLIVLDLRQVGTGQGLATGGLCRALRDRYPDLEIVAGGGLAGLADLAMLERDGASAALVASALHDGRIRPEHLRT